MIETPFLSLDDRLFLPPDTGAILWDLDGTLVDSLELDRRVCGRILSAHAGRAVEIPEAVLREGFALSGADFWAFLFKSLDIEASAGTIEAAHEEWLAQRLGEAFPIHQGIPEVLSAARAAGLRQAVVSNNPQDELVRVLENTGLIDRFEAVAGNDGSGRARKPAPDSYLYAAKALGLDPARCAGIEDSVLGLTAARAAGTHVVAVATGAETFERLRAAGLADACYTGLTRCRVAPALPGGGTVHTPSEDISQVLRALSAGAVPFEVSWNNDDWALLGATLAHRLGRGERARAKDAARIPSPRLRGEHL